MQEVNDVFMWSAEPDLFGPIWRWSPLPYRCIGRIAPKYVQEVESFWWPNTVMISLVLYHLYGQHQIIESMGKCQWFTSRSEQVAKILLYFVGNAGTWCINRIQIVAVSVVGIFNISTCWTDPEEVFTDIFAVILNESSLEPEFKLMSDSITILVYGPTRISDTLAW